MSEKSIFDHHISSTNFEKEMIQLIVLQSGGGGGVAAFVSNYGLLMVMLIVIWLFFIRPQAKKQKAQAKFLEEMQKGDEIVTSSGIIGRINKVEGSVITLEIGNKNFIRILKSSISREMTESLRSTENA